MTTIGSHVRRRHPVRTVVACGLLLGVVDLLLQRILPYPWANLANSSAVWAVGAFGIGWWLRPGWWRPALAGTALLVLAVPAYYLAAAVALGDDVQILWSATAVMWSFFGVLAGALFGAAGGLSDDRRPWLRAVAVALPGAVLLAEAAVLVGRSGDPGGGARYRTDSLQTAAIEAILGVVLILVVARTAGERLRAVAAAAVLTAAGFAAFTLAGFGG